MKIVALTSKWSKVFWHKCLGTLSETSTEILWYLKFSSIFNIEALTELKLSAKQRINEKIPILFWQNFWRELSTCPLASRRSTKESWVSVFSSASWTGAGRLSAPAPVWAAAAPSGVPLSKTRATTNNHWVKRSVGGSCKLKKIRVFLTPFFIFATIIRENALPAPVPAYFLHFTLHWYRDKFLGFSGMSGLEQSFKIWISAEVISQSKNCYRNF